jgi:hypothetical protein
MIHNLSSLLTGFIGVVIGLSLGQEPGPKPVIFTTPPQRILIRLTDQRQNSQYLAGQASLTLLEAGSDDTLRALLIISLPGEERRRLGKQGLELPETIHRQEMQLRWHKGTSCPDIDLDLQATRFEVNGLQMVTGQTKVRIDVSLRTVETLPQLLCSWTRQINSGRPRLGIVMAINRLLIREDED